MEVARRGCAQSREHERRADVIRAPSVSEGLPWPGSKCGFRNPPLTLGARIDLLPNPPQCRAAARRGTRVALALAAAGVLLAPASYGQTGTGRPAPPPAESHQTDRDDGRHQAESDLQAAIAFTRRGEFQRAIPLFLAARGRVAEQFALEFNLALCYVGTRQFPQGIRILSQLGGGQRSGDVKNLLAQALVGDRQQEAAWKTLREAAEITPRNERLYLLVSQACLEEALYDLGIHVLDVGLRNLPDSPRLHFQRGLFYSRLDEANLANREFQRAQELAPKSDIAYIAPLSRLSSPARFRTSSAPLAKASRQALPTTFC